MKPIYCECGRVVENKDTGLCSSCGFAQRKKQRDASAPVKPVKQLKRTTVKKVSDKRKGENIIYAMKAQAYLNRFPLCECCGDKADCIHHKNGRSNEMLTDIKYFMSVCNSCHAEIHANPQWAREMKYSILRSAKETI